MSKMKKAVKVSKKQKARTEAAWKKVFTQTDALGWKREAVMHVSLKDAQAAVKRAKKRAENTRLDEIIKGLTA